MKTGEIIEGYHGQFAKVIRVVEEGGLYTLSAWVNTPAAAEAETIGVTTLNGFGISQVVKEEETKVPKAGSKPAANDAKPKAVHDMTFAELKAYAKTIGVKASGTQLELTAAVVAKLSELMEAEMEDFTVTEEFLTENSALASEGVKVGDTIKVPKAE